MQLIKRRDSFTFKEELCSWEVLYEEVPYFDTVIRFPMLLCKYLMYTKMLSTFDSPGWKGTIQISPMCPWSTAKGSNNELSLSILRTIIHFHIESTSLMCPGSTAERSNATFSIHPIHFHIGKKQNALPWCIQGARPSYQMLLFPSILRAKIHSTWGRPGIVHWQRVLDILFRERRASDFFS